MPILPHGFASCKIVDKNLENHFKQRNPCGSIGIMLFFSRKLVFFQILLFCYPLLGRDARFLKLKILLLFDLQLVYNIGNQKTPYGKAKKARKLPF